MSPEDIMNSTNNTNNDVKRANGKKGGTAFAVILILVVIVVAAAVAVSMLDNKTADDGSLDTPDTESVTTAAEEPADTTSSPTTEPDVDDTASDETSAATASESKDSEPAGDGELNEQGYYTVSGIIKDAAMHTVLVEAEDGTEYPFHTDGAQIITGLTGYILGNPVTVYYTGELDFGGSPIASKIIVYDLPENNPDAQIYRRALDMVATMSVEQRVGQMFIARCPDEDAARKASQYMLGGYILYGEDFENKSREEVKSMIDEYQSASDIPMFIGVDEEGGTVNRISVNENLRDEPFKSPQELYEEGGFELIASDTREKCKLLKDLGINLNFAPVCDVSTGPNDFIYPRSFGADAHSTSEYVKTVVEVMKEEGVGSVLKHFPGCGGNGDTHTSVVYDERPIETFEESDFLPFEAGIAAGADMILVSHNVVECIDPESPASLSWDIHYDILRNELGFEGVIITDELSMEGVSEFASDEDIAVEAVRVGNDMLCCTDFETQIPAVIDAINEHELSLDTINDAVVRILVLKIKLGIL